MPEYSGIEKNLILIFKYGFWFSYATIFDNFNLPLKIMAKHPNEIYKVLYNLSKENKLRTQIC